MNSKRKELLTYPKVQAKWTGVILSLVAMTALLVYASIDIAIQNAAAPDQVFVTADLIRERIRTPFYVAALISLIAGGLVAVFQLHGLLGPIKALEGALYRMQKGELKLAFRIREADDLQDFASEVRAMQEGVKSRVLKDRERARVLKAHIEETAAKLGPDQGQLRQELLVVAKELSNLTSDFQV